MATKQDDTTSIRTASDIINDLRASGRLAGDIAETADRFAAEAFDVPAAWAHSPSTTAGAAIYLAGLAVEEPVTQAEAGEKVDSSKVAIRNLYRDLASGLVETADDLPSIEEKRLRYLADEGTTRGTDVPRREGWPA